MRWGLETLGVIPAGGKADVVGKLHIAGQRVTDHQDLIRGTVRQQGRGGGKKCRIRLLCADLLGDQDTVQQRAQPGAGQLAVLGDLGAVGGTWLRRAWTVSKA